MFEAVVVMAGMIAGVLVALALIGGYAAVRTFTAPENVGNDRQYWS